MHQESEELEVQNRQLEELLCEQQAYLRQQLDQWTRAARMSYCGSSAACGGGVPIPACSRRPQAAACCSCLGYRCGGQIAFEIPIRTASAISAISTPRRVSLLSTRERSGRTHTAQRAHRPERIGIPKALFCTGAGERTPWSPPAPPPPATTRPRRLPRRQRARAQGEERPSAAWTGRAGWRRVAPQGVPWGDSLGKGDCGRLPLILPLPLASPLHMTAAACRRSSSGRQGSHERATRLCRTGDRERVQVRSLARASSPRRRRAGVALPPGAPWHPAPPPRPARSAWLAAPRWRVPLALRQKCV